MDPAVPWQYTYNRLAAQSATSGDLHHHFAQAANNSALTGGHTSSVSGVPSTTSQLLLQAAHSTPLGASSASFATPSSFLSAPSYEVFSPLFHHANPKPAHFNTINAAAQHRQQVLAAQAAVTSKQTSDSDIIRDNYTTQHHSSISTPQTGSYFEQSSGSAVAAAAALAWQPRSQSDFTALRSQGDLNSNNQLPSAFGILPHENVASSPAPSATKHSTSSGSSTGVYESFNAHFPQPLNQANAIIKSSSTARSMSPQQPQQQIKQQSIASTSASSSSVYYQAPSSSSTYQNLQSSFANAKTISQQEQLQHQQSQHSNYNNNSNQAISGSKSSFSCSPGISSSSQLNSTSDLSNSVKEFSNPSHHISTRAVKSERSNSPVITSHNFVSSSALHKLNSSVNQIQTKAALKAIVPNPSFAGANSLNQNRNHDQNPAQGHGHGHGHSHSHGHGHGHGQSHVPAIHENIVIQSSPISFSMLENQVAFSDSNNSHSASNTSRNASSMRKLSTQLLKQTQEFQHESASSNPNPNPNPNLSSNPTSNSGHSPIHNSSNQKHQIADCSHIVIPRRPSPQQISSQPSPLGAVPSPAYPTYNSPMNTSQSPIDASISRPASKGNQVAYSSVIQRAALPSNWEGQSSPQSSIYNQMPAQITKLHQISPVQSIDSHAGSQFDSSQSASHQNHNSNLVTAQKMTADSVQQIQSQTSVQFELNQHHRQRQNISTDPNKKDEYKSRPGRKKKISDRIDSERLPSPSTCSEYYANERVPPPAHVSNQQTNGSPNSNCNTIHNHNHSHSHSSAMISHPSHHHSLSLSHSHSQPHHPHPHPHPYFPSYSMPLGIGDYSSDLNLNSISMVGSNPYNDSLGTPSVSSNYSPTTSEIREDEQPKVVVPNIEEELGFLAENNRTGSIQQASAPIQHQTASTQNHLTLLGSANNVLSHHNQTSQQQQQHQHQQQQQQQQQQSHLQHSSQHTNQNAGNSQSSASNQMSQQKTPLTDKKFPTPTGPGSGFMQSYLKFLQGERDTSPPPVNRAGGGRKSWSRNTNQTVSQVSPATVNQPPNAKNQMSNGMNMHNSMMGASNAYDRKRIAAIVDDDDDTSDSSIGKQQSTSKNSKKQSQQSVVERAPQVPINAAKKARIAQTSHSNSLLSSQQTTNSLSLQQNNPHNLQQNPQLLMQQHASPAHQLVAGTSQILSQQQMYYPDEDPLTVPPRRETSHRKAKGRSILNTLQKQTFGLDNQADEFDEPPEFVDSDSDPAWTPQKGNDDDDDDDMPRRKIMRKRPTNKSNARRCAIKSNSFADGVDANNDFSNSKVKTNSSTTSNSYGTSNNHNSDEFQTGDFIISRQDVFVDWPAIWRVDSKTLLQKFEPFQSNNKTVYRSLSTYAQWTPENRKSYVLAKCKYVGQLQHEIHVELLRNELCSSTSEMYIEKVMTEAHAYQDQFEVFIQTLISQALDSNFLIEIMQEQDDYFLSNVKTIDNLTAERKLRLRNSMPWPDKMLYAIETWPCYNIINDLGVTNNGQIICAACNKRSIVSRIILYGQTYNPSTVGPIQLDSRYTFEKDFLLCRSCVARCELFHKIAHQKYLMFVQCSKKVQEKNGEDPTKGTTAILNELLADEVWLTQLFKMVRRAWGEADQADREHRLSR